MVLTNKKITCSSCNNGVYKPVFVDNYPHCYTCAQQINPNVQKPTMRDCWVLADSHNYKGESYRKIRAVFEGNHYHGWVIAGEVESCFVLSGEDLFVNLNKFAVHVRFS